MSSTMASRVATCYLSSQRTSSGGAPGFPASLTPSFFVLNSSYLLNPPPFFHFHLDLLLQPPAIHETCPLLARGPPSGHFLFQSCSTHFPLTQERELEGIFGTWDEKGEGKVPLTIIAIRVRIMSEYNSLRRIQCTMSVDTADWELVCSDSDIT